VATRNRVKLADVKTYTMRELNQNTAHVIDEINDSCQPAVITKHGRFIALITPMRDVAIEELVLSHGPLADEISRRASDDEVSTLSSDEVLQRIRDRNNSVADG
jgi:prevent-host-death family protein